MKNQIPDLETQPLPAFKQGQVLSPPNTREPLNSSGDAPPAPLNITGRAEEYTSLKSTWSQVVLPLLTIRLLLTFVGIVAAYYIFPIINHAPPLFKPGPQGTHLPDMLVYLWNRFDSNWYLSIAHGGYESASTLHEQTNWAFFPFYPLLIHIFAWPFGSSLFADNLMGLIISNLSMFVAGFYLYRLTAREINPTVAARAVYYLALYPMSMYLFAIYPESLFLALVISSIYYARLRRWWLAGVLGGLATLTRNTGIFLVIVIGWEYWQYHAERVAPMERVVTIEERMRSWMHSRFLGFWRAFTHWSTWSGLVSLMLIPAGLGLFLLYSKWQTGTFDAYLIAEHSGWNHYLSNPLTLVISGLRHPRVSSPYDWDFYLLNMGSILVFTCLLIPVFRRLPPLYGILMVCFLLVPLMSSRINSVARYYLTLFPAFMWLAWWSSQGSTEQQMRRHNLLSISLALLLSVAMVMFTLSINAMA